MAGVRAGLVFLALLAVTSEVPAVEMGELRLRPATVQAPAGMRGTLVAG